MPIEANYETYYGIKLPHYSYSWGGITYGGTNTNGILVKEFPDEYLMSTTSTNVLNMNFLYPRSITPKAYIDGTAEGHFTVFNKHADDGTSTATSTVTSYTVTIKKTADIPSSEETLGTYSNTLSTVSEVYPQDYLTIPFFIQLSEEELEANEKIIFNITYAGTYETNMCISHELDSSIIDLKIKMPFAPEGG